MRVYLVNTGLWHIDNTFGKTILVVELGNETHALSRAPTHDEICDVIDKCLEAELNNDIFTFHDGSQRPTQIFEKCQEMKNHIGDWELKAKKAGLYGCSW